MSTVWTPEMIHSDMDTIIDFVVNNWGFGVQTQIETPEEVWVDHGQNDDYIANKIRQVWMYARCIKLEEGGTEFSLLDMSGNADRTNDTTIAIEIYSKRGRNDALGMYNRFLQLIRNKTFMDLIGTYAFLQITDFHIKPKRYFCRITATIWLTRRGIGHV